MNNTQNTTQSPNPASNSQKVDWDKLASQSKLVYYFFKTCEFFFNKLDELGNLID